MPARSTLWIACNISSGSISAMLWLPSGGIRYNSICRNTRAAWAGFQSPFSALVVCYLRATCSNVLAMRFCSALACCWWWVWGLMPCDSSSLILSRSMRAALSDRAGYVPRCCISCFLLKVYLMRQYRRPLASIYRYKPPPSDSCFTPLSGGGVCLHWLSVSFI